MAAVAVLSCAIRCMHMHSTLFSKVPFKLTLWSVRLTLWSVPPDVGCTHNDRLIRQRTHYVVPEGAGDGTSQVPSGRLR